MSPLKLEAFMSAPRQMVLRLEIGFIGRILLVGDFYCKALDQPSLEMRLSIFSVALPQARSVSHFRRGRSFPQCSPG